MRMVLSDKCWWSSVVVCMMMMTIQLTSGFQAPIVSRWKWAPSTVGTSSATGTTGTSGSRYSKMETELASMKDLVEDVSNSLSRKTVFVGGKGGVGKTSISSALAVELASSSLADDLKVLVVSTDPAHSLGDALDVELSSSSGKKIQMTDALTRGNLYACEVDPSTALSTFREALEALDVNKLADALGIPPETLEEFGLGQVSELLQNPPPGLDELVALGNVLNFDDDDDDNYFDVVVVDTAPTGHTLRLLALPQFLDGFLGKVLQLRIKLSGLASTLQAFLGGGEQQRQRTQTIDSALQKLEYFKTTMSNLKTRLQDPSQTNFVVVSIPTQLSVKESQRLLLELQSQNVAVTNIVINQCLLNTNTHNDNNENNDDNQLMKQYYLRRRAGQQKWIDQLQSSLDQVSASPEYQSNDGNKITITQVPFSDIELVGVPALAYLGQSTFVNNPDYDYLLSPSSSTEDSKFIICGGKGGVGKTTTSSSLAVTMAAQGHSVALISTDPAHSLGDAFAMQFNGGQLIDVPLIGVPPTDGTLSVMEIDPVTALQDFKKLVDNFIGNSNQNMDQNTAVSQTIKEISELFDTLPAGTDEVVALAKVIKLVQDGNFDRIVLDTAPTGHTLRMLSTPSFIAEFIDTLIAITNKLNSNAMVRMLLSSGGKTMEDWDETAQAAKSALLKFQFQMYDLEDLFANAQQTEFCIVTIPTELAVRESIRLVNDLTFESPDMPLKVRNVIVNQILQGDDDDDDGTLINNFVQRVSSSQKLAISDLQTTISQLKDPPTITKVPYLDTEPRGVFGLKALSMELLSNDDNA